MYNPSSSPSSPSPSSPSPSSPSPSSPSAPSAPSAPFDGLTVQTGIPVTPPEGSGAGVTSTVTAPPPSEFTDLDGQGRGQFREAVSGIWQDFKDFFKSFGDAVKFLKAFDANHVRSMWPVTGTGVDVKNELRDLIDDAENKSIALRKFLAFGVALLYYTTLKPLRLVTRALGLSKSGRVSFNASFVLFGKYIFRSPTKDNPNETFLTKLGQLISNSDLANINLKQFKQFPVTTLFNTIGFSAVFLVTGVLPAVAVMAPIKAVRLALRAVGISAAGIMRIETAFEVLGAALYNDSPFRVLIVEKEGGPAEETKGLLNIVGITWERFKRSPFSTAADFIGLMIWSAPAAIILLPWKAIHLAALALGLSRDGFFGKNVFAGAKWMFKDLFSWRENKLDVKNAEEVVHRPVENFFRKMGKFVAMAPLSIVAAPVWLALHVVGITKITLARIARDVNFVAGYLQKGPRFMRLSDDNTTKLRRLILSQQVVLQSLDPVKRELSKFSAIYGTIRLVRFTVRDVVLRGALSLGIIGTIQTVHHVARGVVSTVTGGRVWRSPFHEDAAHPFARARNAMDINGKVQTERYSGGSRPNIFMRAVNSTMFLVGRAFNRIGRKSVDDAVIDAAEEAVTECSETTARVDAVVGNERLCSMYGTDRVRDAGNRVKAVFSRPASG